ncbi:VOC family protein [Deinococcus altitudinis]|uniref:VOC family protein n=1 Tax=Deinococcus altitudinis TaxID=468914 RepID=UPI0038915527
MNFNSIRMVTGNVQRMVSFYEQITGQSAIWSTPDFAEMRFHTVTLAIAHENTIALFGAGAARPADNHSLIIEFLVEDVDADYARLSAALQDLVLPPTTQPWGNRSLLFRDPDGNLINLFTPVSEAAQQKFKEALAAMRQH